MPKDRVTRRIDARPQIEFGQVSAVIEAVAADAPPDPASIPYPIDLALATALTYSAVTPSANIYATWTPYDGPGLFYALQCSTDSAFADSVTETYRTAVGVGSLVIENRHVGTLYYVRIATIADFVQSEWSASVSITTPLDTTPPAVPTSAAAAFAGVGDLVISWTNPASLNFRDVEISIWSNSGKTVQLALLYDATGRRVWTAAENLAATSGAGDPSVYVELRSRSYGNAYSTAVVVGTITKAVPATPGTIVQSWSGDTGTAGADLVIAWASQADAASFSLSLNGLTARRIYGTTYTYPLDRNIADNTTADPTITYSLIAVDGLNQSSTAATGTATNAAPPAPTVALAGGFSLIVATVTGTKAGDFAAYEYVFKRDGTTVRTLESAASEQQYELSAAGDSGSHSWTVAVRQKDLFAQYSSATTSSAVVMDALTLDFLRGSLAFTDSDSNTFSPPSSGTLAVLKDGTTGSGGVTYAP